MQDDASATPAIQSRQSPLSSIIDLRDTSNMVSIKNHQREKGAEQMASQGRGGCANCLQLLVRGMATSKCHRCKQQRVNRSKKENRATPQQMVCGRTQLTPRP